MYFSICSWLKGNVLDPSKQSLKAKVLFAPRNYKCFFMLPCWEKDCFLVFLAKELYLTDCIRCSCISVVLYVKWMVKIKGCYIDVLSHTALTFMSHLKVTSILAVVSHMSYLLSGSVLSFALLFHTPDTKDSETSSTRPQRDSRLNKIISIQWVPKENRKYTTSKKVPGCSVDTSYKKKLLGY